MSSKEIPLSSKYLGAPLCIGSPKRQLFNSLVDKMHSKLAGWKSNLLSLAGRRILVNHVLSGMPIPLRWYCLWSADSSLSKRYHIRWDTICLPTSKGGLGIRHLKEQNEASFLKLGWAAAVSSSIWANWMKAKAIWNPSTPKSGSCIWQKIRFPSQSKYCFFLDSEWLDAPCELAPKMLQISFTNPFKS